MTPPNRARKIADAIALAALMLVPGVVAGIVALSAAGPFLTPLTLLRAQVSAPTWSDQEKPIEEQLHGLRQLPDDARARATVQLAIRIRQLPVTPNKLRLAAGLAGLSTEGDFGHYALHEVALTLASALTEQAVPGNATPPNKDESAAAYLELAELARYEHSQVTLDSPPFAAAMSKLEADDSRRQHANFTLTDFSGKSWTLNDLHGKVVLVNFWATWCPPCRKEMPDLEALYNRFKDQGLVVLAISDEDASKVKPFVEERHVTYPILLDPGRKVNGLFQIDGIPKSFVYDRNGKLVAESIDMRTQKQFLEMLALAGLR